MKPDQLQALANQAQQYLQSNRLNEARDCYLKMSSVIKDNPGIWLTLGGIEGRLGNFDKAGDYFKKVIKLAPGQADGYLNLAKTQSAMAMLDLAEKNFEMALSIQPGLTEAAINLANIQGQKKNYSAAKENFYKVLKQNKNIASVHFGLAVCQQALKEYVDAEKSYRFAIQLQSNYPEAYNSLGTLLQLLQRPEEALVSYKKAIEQNGNYAIAYYNLGMVLHELGHFVEAKNAYHSSVAINPKFAEAYVALGRTVEVSGSLKQSAECYQKALAINPDNIEALINLGRVRASQGKFDQALELYQRSATLNPAQVEAITGQVHVLERKGLFDDAYALLQPLLDEHVQNPSVAIAFATLGKRIGRHDEGRELLEELLLPAQEEIPAFKRSVMHFTLGSIYQDQKLYDSAFENFQQANQLLPYRFNIEEYKQNIDQIIRFGSRALLDSLPGSTLNTSRPIFILGMPRSGTSLVEQIIASHPQVFGGGELSFINECSKNTQQLTNSAQSFPACIAGLTQDNVDALAQHYLSQMDEINTATPYMTDKMPHNFMDLALIELMFPQAKIIHCMRNPMDTCLSIYTQNFSANHSYSADLEHLGQYYLEYQRLMQHWRDNLKIPVFELQYEELIADQERKTRELIEFCGLEWNDVCLNFHNSGRAVVTPSYDQVRQPLYKGAVERWLHYEKYLQPLRNVLNM